jgi:[citrate (pro-3S)-lyase] ligase
MFKIKEVLLDIERDIQISFLNKHGLDYEYDIDYAILVYDEHEVIATASIANNVMKCFVVHSAYTGQNVSGLMFKHLTDYLEAKGITHYFVFTTPENEEIFKSFNMTRIVLTMNTVLLEGGAEINTVLKNLKKEYNLSDNKKSCVIINANPMTLGHLYLIETAAKKSNELLVFVVSEDLSTFPFKARFNIIKEATKHLENVTVLPSLSYLVSRISFPKYFLKEDVLIKDEQTLLDVLIYKGYYSKIFNINKRFLGTEPYSPNTSKYNSVLKNYLGNHIEIIERKEIYDAPISASYIRKLIKQNNIIKIKDYVPKATYDYLLSEDGQLLIEYIQTHDLGRH